MKNEIFEEEVFNKRIDVDLWKRILHFISPYKRTVSILFLIAIFLAALEAALTLIAKDLVDAIVDKDQEISLRLYGLEFFTCVASISLLISGFIVFAGYLSTHLSFDIRKAGFEKLQQLSFSYFDKKPVGWLMARMTSDCDRLSQIFAWGSVDLVWGCTLMATLAGIMLYLHVKLALIVLMVMPVVVWMSAIFQEKILKSSRRVRKVNSKLTASYNEALMGIKTTKSLVREEENFHDFSSLANQMERYSVKNALYSALYLPLILILGSVGSALALYYGGMFVASEQISVGTLVAFLSYASLFFHPIQQVARIFAEIQYAQASAERIMGLIDTEVDIKDSPAVLQLISQAKEMSGDEKACDGYDKTIETIEFKDVSFAYQDGSIVLRDFNLLVHRGQSVALVGETGGGKSTIVNLLSRFYEPTSGSILINGVDYRERSLSWLQSSLGIVLQEPHLFSGTIIENIRYGNLEATDERVIEASRLVKAYEFIMQMKNGFDSFVGEGGALLSTGEKQLISFARAILANPQIFIMDEATSSIDAHTEELIQLGLERVIKNRTSFIIAHRLSTIRGADKIVVIERGQMIECGTHHELMKRQSHYYELYTKQFEKNQAGLLLG